MNVTIRKNLDETFKLSVKPNVGRASYRQHSREPIWLLDLSRRHITIIVIVTIEASGYLSLLPLHIQIISLTPLVDFMFNQQPSDNSASWVACSWGLRAKVRLLILSILLSSYSFYCNLRVFDYDWYISLLRTLLTQATIPQGDTSGTLIWTSFEYENLSTKPCTTGNSLKKHMEHYGVKGFPTDSYLRETHKQMPLLLWQQ